MFSGREVCSAAEGYMPGAVLGPSLLGETPDVLELLHSSS